MAGNEGDISELDTPLSRDGSYFSLTSGNSVYVTAQGSLADSVDSAGSGGPKCPEGLQLLAQLDTRLSMNPNETLPPSLSPVQRCSLGSKGSSSSTLAEGESLFSEEELAFLSPDSEDPGFRYSHLENRSGSSSENAENEGRSSTATAGLLEVKEDVSRICNALAEASNPDLEKQYQIEAILGGTIGIDERRLDRDSLKKLRELAVTEGGLLSNTLRKMAWPFLLGIPQEDIQAFETRKLPKKLEIVAEDIKNLVHMDVARVLKRFPPGLSDPQQDHLLTYLTTLICSVLEKNPGAYYYQGFHDISLTFLLVCISQSAPYLAYLCLNRMVESSLAPFMEVTMDATHDLIHVVFSIIEQEDEVLFNKIVKENKCPVAFCLPWVLTWFSHTLPNDSDVFRLYDFILGCLDEVTPPCLIPIFTSAALVLRGSHKIKTTVKETDIASMHQALSLLPSEQNTLEPWLQESLNLMRKYSGRETELRSRAVKIKDLQFELWTQDDTNNNRRRGRGVIENNNDDNGNRFLSAVRFIFVRHRWVTAAIIVLGTAYLLQARYDLGSKLKWSSLQEYMPHQFRSLFDSFLNEFEFEGFLDKK